MTNALQQNLIKLEKPASGAAFLERCQSFLLEDEALNNLPLGIASAPPSAPWTPEGAYWAIASDLDKNSIVLTAIQTPPRPVVLSGGHVGAAEAIAIDLLSNESDRVFPGVLGLPEPARAFAQTIQQTRGGQVRVRMRQGAYQLSEVRLPQGVPGHFREARLEEAELLEGWAGQFGHDAGHPDEAEIFRSSVKPRIGARFLYVWEREGQPVSMASLGRFTPNGAVISLVYTPKELRGRGFGAAVTAALSEHCLKQGRRYCFLYADLDNPASNKIYKAMGYSLRGETLLLVVEPATENS